MADLAEVGDALVDVIVQAAYPNGTEQPSIAGCEIDVYSGWPEPKELAADLRTGQVHISVFPRPGERVTTSLSADWQTLSIHPPTLFAAVTDTTVTLSGIVSLPKNIALIVDGIDFVYAVQDTDTLQSIAAALAMRVNAKQPATSAGAVISIPNARRLIARIGTTGVCIRELRRQEKTFQITIWASHHDARDCVAAVMDTELAALCRIPLPDGTTSVLRYRGSIQDDDRQKQEIYRRDLFYDVEYATTMNQTTTTITLPQLKVSGGPALDRQGPVTLINS